SFLELIQQQQTLLRGGRPAPTSAGVDKQTPPAVAEQAPAAASPSVPSVPAEPATTPSSAARPAPAAPVAPAAPAAASGRAGEVLLEVVAEKTGYPVEMLELEMALDADLGIDSIKRVEILSALQERLPEAPAVRPEDLGGLQTLGQIVAHLEAAASGQTAATEETAAGAAIDREAVAAALMNVIAAKTGYPVEMLEPEMALDADLGIDSIKRVEILSALQEELPAAPAIKPEHLGTLQTVAQIIDFLASVSGAVDERPSQRRALDPVQTGEGIERKVLKVVPLQARGDRARFALDRGKTVWVGEDGSPLTDVICQRLKDLQLEPVKVAYEDSETLEVPASLAGLVLLAPAAGANDRMLDQAFRLVQKASGRLQEAARQGEALLATVSRLNGGFGLPPGPVPADAVSGGLAGLAKTAGLEWPAVHCKALDLAPEMDDPEKAAQLIVDELLVDGPVEVGVTGQGLQTLKLTEARLPEDELPPPLAVGDLVVISGGARGVTAEAAVALASSCRATLLLLGRSALAEAEPAWLSGLSSEADIKQGLAANATQPLKPRALEDQYQQVLRGREIANNLQRIRDAGGQVVYRSVDLRDAAAVSGILEEIRSEYGPVRGLIHGAGVLADRLIEDKTSEQFAEVYSTKVAGLRALLEATQSDDLQFMALFSSSTGRFGRSGQVDYAVANEVLNKLAQQQARQRPECRVLSLNWGPWDGGMVTPALKDIFAREGVEVIDLRAGADYLLKELSTPAGGPVELVILGSSKAAHVDHQPQPHPNIYVSRALELELSIDQFPFLKSHVIDTKAVLPMAVMVEWLAHGAIHENPGLKFHGFNDLRVLKGVTLEPGQQHALQVMTGKAFKSDGFHVVPVELSGTDGQGQHFVHARAKIVLAGHLPAGREPAAALSLPDYPRGIAEIYRPERLFHGSDFHGLREMIGCSPEGITALARPAPLPAEWISQPLRNAWLADPLALDSAFQLMILWSFEKYQAGSLPVFAGRYRQYVEKFPEDGAEIRVRLCRDNASKATAWIEFLDLTSGSLLARLEDYECVIDASLNESFQRNKLQGAA
ncbi:MAG TPA: SDR family NAD(P)-dependent oxidoreductase, partial [Desulfuromonadales bacterium]|nr:SDR family NAD(P)-dependent oxidoreductase [Desulfuromonadales bacterium]